MYGFSKSGFLQYQLINSSFVIKSMDISGWIIKLLYKYRRKTNILLFNWLVHFTCYLKKVKLGSHVIFNGIPTIRRFPFSRITIGDNCEFNSSKNSVIVGLQKPCTFFTISKESEIVIGDHSGASGATLVAVNSIKIGSHVLIGANCTIVDNDFHNSDPSVRIDGEIPGRPVIIEDNVFLGFNCMVLKGVTIGENSVIGANSVVINNIPRNSIAIGNPCKVIIKKDWVS
jgi:acetyltransferase-like isoleucine patch superfamily enzyme